MDGWRYGPQDTDRVIPHVHTSQGVPMPANQDLLERITACPDVFEGKPIVRDMRIPVELILSLLSQGATHEELLEDYPGLEPEDIRAMSMLSLPGIGSTQFRWRRREVSG